MLRHLLFLTCTVLFAACNATPTPTDAPGTETSDATVSDTPDVPTPTLGCTHPSLGACDCTFHCGSDYLGIRCSGTECECIRNGTTTQRFPADPCSANDEEGRALLLFCGFSNVGCTPGGDGG